MTRAVRQRVWGVALVAFLVSWLGCSRATQATTLVVDDDNVQCPNAPFHTIAAALAVRNPGDDILVCLGTYAEQIVLTDSIPIRGLPVNLVRPVIAPPALPATRLTFHGLNPVAAGIIVDTARARIENLEIDLTGVASAACSPILAGIYLRNASGSVVNVDVHGPSLPTRLDCDSGVGLLVESGDTVDSLLRPVKGRAVAVIRQGAYDGFQKAAVVGVGGGTLISIKGLAAQGLGPQPVLVQNAVQVSDGARGKMRDLNIAGVETALPGVLATGVLTIGDRNKVRTVTITDSQVGTALIGNRNVLLKSQLVRMSSDGVVVLGDSNRLKNLDLVGCGVDCVYIDGDNNVLLGLRIANTPLGIWNFAGMGTVLQQIVFETGVDLHYRQGDDPDLVRNLSASSFVPFTTTCATALECDDGNPCTTDACDAVAGTCSSQNVVDGTSCADADVCNGAETCVAGVCTAGVALTCDDANECTTDTCDSLLGCQFTAVLDGTLCSTGTCLGGLCM